MSPKVTGTQASRSAMAVIAITLNVGEEKELDKHAKQHIGSVFS